MASGVENAIRVIWGLLVRLVVVIATAYILYRVRTILISVLISILLTYMLLPVVDWMCGKRIFGLHTKTQRLIATVIVFVAFIGLTVGVIAIIVTPFNEELSRFTDSFQEYSNQIKSILSSISKWYAKVVPNDVKGFIGNLDYSSLAKTVSDYMQQLLTFTKSWIGFALEIVLIPVLAFYFVLDHRTLTREIYGLVPKRRIREAVKIGHEVGMIMQSYVVGQIILCALAGLLTGLFLWGLGVPYIVVLALFAAITRAIPVVGPVVSGIPIVLVGVLNSHGLAIPMYLLTFVIVMHFAESKFIMPKLIGDRLRLHPAVVIIVLLVGAEFFGLIGMFLAAPVAAILRELIRLYYITPRAKARDLIIKEDTDDLVPMQEME
ncbi:MAG: AI-2E family transporter [Armatimonadota bacterium]|nr:AI-2E family transporter [bacterium]